MCKIKYFICDPVSVTKKLRPLQAKIKYQCAHNYDKLVLHCVNDVKRCAILNILFVTRFQ